MPSTPNTTCVQPTEPAPNSFPTLAASSQRRSRNLVHFGLIPITVLVFIEWIMFIAAIKVNERLSDEYFGYVNAGSKVPSSVDYPPFPTQGVDKDVEAILILCLVPLGYDTFFLSIAFVCAHFNRTNKVFILCVSIFAFLSWSFCGSFNVLTCLSAREETWDPTFSSLFGTSTAIQIILGFAWLLALIAAARSVDKDKKERWMAEGAERAMRRPAEHEMQDLPAYQA